MNQIRAIKLIAIMVVSFCSAACNKSTSSTAGPATQAICVQLAVAAEHYFADYDEMPVTLAGRDWEGDTKNGDFIAVLAAVGKEAEAKNVRRVNYLEGMKEVKAGGGKYGLDLKTNPDKPAVIDPHGKEFKVILDTNFDFEVKNPDGSDSNLKTIRRKAIVWSAGPNGDWNTWKDNQKSW